MTCATHSCAPRPGGPGSGGPDPASARAGAEARDCSAAAAAEMARSRRRGEALAVLRLSITAADAADHTPAGLTAVDWQGPVMAECARRMRLCLRGTDLVVHDSGLCLDVLLPGADPAAARAVGQRLRYACSGRYRLTAGPQPLVVVVSVSLVGTPGQDRA